jgi:hypothetical protein
MADVLWKEETSMHGFPTRKEKESYGGDQAEKSHQIGVQMGGSKIFTCFWTWVYLPAPVQ